MNKPVRYRGQFIVTTKGNRRIALCCSKEQAEYYLERGRHRKLWQWVNDNLRNNYGYQLVKSSKAC